MAATLAMALTMALAGCIPPAADAIDISRNAPTAAPQAELPLPLPVPEKAIVAPTPSWSPAVVERNARQVESQIYVVQRGDSLFAIAGKTGAGASAIASANNLQMPYAIKTGDKLQIPGGRYHRVGTGETGIAIARAYNVAWADIVATNALQPPFMLQIGQNLLLPSEVVTGTVADAGTLESRAAAFTLNIDDIVTGGQQAGLPSVIPPSPASGFAGRFLWPVRGSIVSRFGAQGGGRVNDGLDIAAAQGTAVRSAANGIIVYSGNEIGVFGGLVLVDHGQGWITAYGHLGRLDVRKGDRVVAGQMLGGVGETGYVTQPQLHFEIRKDRKPLNPMAHLPSDG